MVLNVRQKRILELLSINSRFTNKDIGKIVGLSEDSVDYQITKLIKEDKFANFSIQFDYRFLGYSHYHVFIRLGKLDFNISELLKIKSLTSINSSYGRFDLQLIVIARDKIELDKSLKKIEEVLSIQNISIAEFDSFYKRFTNIISPISLHSKIPINKKNKVYDLNERSHSNAKEIIEIKLDNIDKKIIKELIKNPRIKFSDLSKKTRLNHETIRYRINGYVSRKFLKNFGLLHDFSKYGLYTNYLLLKLRNVDIKKFKDYLQQNENIFYSAKLIGEYNCMIYITSKNPDEFGVQLKEIRNLLKDSIIDMDLLHLEKIHKYVQFPEEMLENEKI